MISQQITITTTPASIPALINVARKNSIEAEMKAVGFSIRFAKAETALVILSDGKTRGTGSVILNSSEQLYSFSLSDWGPKDWLLNTNAGTVVAHVVVEQG